MNIPAQCGLCHGHRYTAIKISAIALEKFMRLQVYQDIQITRRAAANAGFSLTAQADAASVFNTGRNFNFQVFVFVYAPFAAARLAGVFNNLALA